MADVEDSVPQNEPIVGILVLSLDIMTNAPPSLPPSLNVTYNDDLTSECSPNPEPVHNFLDVALLTENKKVGRNVMNEEEKCTLGFSHQPQRK